MNEQGRGGFGDHPENINLAGRPPGTLSLMTIIKHVLAETPEGQTKTNAEIIVRQQIEKVIADNDGTAFRDLVDRIDGKAMQKIEMSNALDAEWLDIFKDMHDQADSETESDSDSLREESTEDSDS